MIVEEKHAPMEISFIHFSKRTVPEEPLCRSISIDILILMQVVLGLWSASCRSASERISWGLVHGCVDKFSPWQRRADAIWCSSLALQALLMGTTIPCRWAGVRPQWYLDAQYKHGPEFAISLKNRNFTVKLFQHLCFLFSKRLWWKSCTFQI